MARPSQGYRLKDGTPVPGTTTICGRFKDAGALVGWAYKQGCEHGRLRALDKPAPRHLYDVVGDAALAGTIAHDLIEADILGRPRGVFEASPEIFARATNAFEQFKEWQASTRLQIIATECPYVSEAHRYGGTIDAIGKDSRDNIVLLDWKSSNSVYSDHLMQLAAYAMLLEECAPEYTPRAFHLLRVAKESADFAHFYFGELEHAKRSFLLMRELYDLDAKIKKRVA